MYVATDLQQTIMFEVRDLDIQDDSFIIRTGTGLQPAMHST
jgi:hypothetical protein